MIRLAQEKLLALENTSQADTAEVIKLIIEWRGRVSILTDSDRAYAADILNLDTDNAAGLLDLYEICGPGVGWRPSHHRLGERGDGDDDSDDGSLETTIEEEEDPPVGWPLLTGSQDEVDEVIFRALGPYWQPPWQDNLPALAGDEKYNDDEDGDTDGSSSRGGGDGGGDDDSTRRRRRRRRRQRRKRKGRGGIGSADDPFRSPLATSWAVVSYERLVHVTSNEYILPAIQLAVCFDASCLTLFDGIGVSAAPNREISSQRAPPPPFFLWMGGV